jgi:molybdopterin-binding protein
LAEERVRIEIGFAGGQIVGSFVEALSADELEAALGST